MRSRLKNLLRRSWQVTRNPALRTEVNRVQSSVTRYLNERRNDRWSTTLESLNPEDQSLYRTTKRVMGIPTPYHSIIAVSDFQESEALADSLEAQFQPITVPSFPALIDMVDEALELYLQTSASEPQLTNPDDVQNRSWATTFARLRAQTVYRTGP
jgi:hypothetical protein